MLNTRTKQINSYGKRGKRVVDVTVASASAPAAKEIISIFDDLPPAPAWAPIASRMKGRENAGTPAKQKPKAQAPKVVAGQRKARLSKPLSPPRKPHAALKDSKQAVQKDEDVGTGIGKAKTKGAPLRDKLGLEIDSPPRKPLPTHLVNLKASPAVSLATRATKQRGAGTKPSSGLTKPTSPIVNMDIFVLDDEGRVVSKERRSSRTGVAAPPKQSAKATNSKVAKANAKVPVYVDSESEVEMIENPTRGQLKSKKRTTRTIVSDESDSDCDAPIPAPNFTTTDPKPKSTKTKPLQQARTTVEVKATNPKPVKRASTVEVLVPPAPYPTKSIPSLTSLPPTTLPVQPPKPRVPVQSRAPAFQLPASPIFRNRQLTPIRGRRSQGLFEPPSPPTPSYSELDLSLDFDELSLEGADISNLSIAEASIPECLRLLLEECHQEDIGPHDFSSFIESFPFDEILRAARERAGGELSFKKIGEASYSEVFGIGNVVLKVIPLRDEAPVAASNKVKPALKLTQKSARTVEESEEDGPFTSDARDVRKEIIVTRAMGEVHRGFVKLLKTYVVKGKYPEALLRLWDEYYEEKGSESVRPGKKNIKSNCPISELIEHVRRHLQSRSSICYHRSPQRWPRPRSIYFLDPLKNWMAPSVQCFLAGRKVAQARRASCIIRGKLDASRLLCAVGLYRSAAPRLALGSDSGEENQGEIERCECQLGGQAVGYGPFAPWCPSHHHRSGPFADGCWRWVSEG